MSMFERFNKDSIVVEKPSKPNSLGESTVAQSFVMSGRIVSESSKTMGKSGDVVDIVGTLVCSADYAIDRGDTVIDGKNRYIIESVREKAGFIGIAPEKVAKLVWLV